MTLLGRFQHARTIAAYKRRIAASSLVGQYPLDERAGSTAYDRSLRGRNGVLTGVTLAATGVSALEKCITLPGTGTVLGNLTASGAPAQMSGAEGTFSGWFKVSAAGDWTDGAARYMLFMSTDGNNQVYVRKQTTSNQIAAVHVGASTSRSASVSSFSPTTWFHIAVSWSLSAGGAAQCLKLYVNGEPTSGAAVGLGTWAGTPANLFIGASAAAGSSQWKGSVADVRLFNAALSHADIAQLARRKGQIVFEGDSRTIYTAFAGAYPTDVMALAGITPLQYGWLNSGVSGEKVTDMIAAAAAGIDVHARPSLRNVCVLFGGLNDANAGDSAATIHTNIAAFCTARKAAGYRVVVCTEIDCQSAQANAVNFSSTLRAALNTLIRANYTTYAHALADIGAEAHLSDATDTTYYQADKTHMKDPGNTIIASVVGPAILAAI